MVSVPRRCAGDGGWRRAERSISSTRWGAMTPARAARRTRRAMTTPPARATRCRENRRQAIPKAVRPAPSRAPTRAGARETSVIADPGVEVDVGDVHQEVRDDDHEGDDHDDALGDGVVASQGRVHEQLPHPGPAEHRLGGGRAGQNPRDRHPQDGHEGDEGVAHRVAPDDHAGREALGMGGPDVVLADHFQDAAAGVTGEAGHEDQPQGQGREGKVAQAVEDHGKARRDSRRVDPPGGINTPGVPPGLPMVLDRLSYLPLPALALGLVFMASFARYTRSSVLEVIRQDYIRTAHAKGLPPRVVVRRHAVRNALIPLVTVLGVAVPGVLAGTPLTETVFSWPGVGKLLVDSTLGGDYAVAQGIIMVIALMVIVANLLVDVAYVYLDPRIRYD